MVPPVFLVKYLLALPVFQWVWDFLLGIFVFVHVTFTEFSQLVNA